MLQWPRSETRPYLRFRTSNCLPLDSRGICHFPALLLSSQYLDTRKQPPFECCLPITFLHTCEHEDFLLPINVLVWLNDLIPAEVSHYTTIVCFIPLQTLGTKMYLQVASTPSSHWRNLLVILHSPYLLIWQKRILENSSDGRALSMHMYEFMPNKTFALHFAIHILSRVTLF